MPKEQRRQLREEIAMEMIKNLSLTRAVSKTIDSEIILGICMAESKAMKKLQSKKTKKRKRFCNESALPQL